MFKDLLFVLICFSLAIIFGVFTIKKVVQNRYGTVEKSEPIKRTVEMIDPNYDKKYGR
jgi:hypothetical protein